MHQGKTVVFPPPHRTEEEASEWGFQKLGGDFEIECLITRDVAKATRTIKRIVFERTSSLDIAMQRAKHQMPRGDI